MAQDNIRVQLQSAFAHKTAGRLGKAAKICARVLETAPEHFHANYLLGLIYAEQGDPPRAIPAFTRAAQAHPGDFESRYNLAVCLNLAGRHEAALAHYAAALQIDPRHARATHNYANSLAKLGRLEQASQIFARLVSQHPGYAEGLYNYGVVLNEMGRYEDALKNGRRLVELSPSFAEAHQICGIALASMFRPKEALVYFERAFKLKPTIDFLPGTLLYLRGLICDWTDYQAQIEAIEAGLRASRKVAEPFPLLAVMETDELNLKASRLWAANKAAALGPPAVFARSPRREKIRIGYFSADFHDHATSHLLAGVLEHHDRDAFEILGFSFGPDGPSEMRERVSRAFSSFSNVRYQSDAEIAALARSADIDIAVDLKGYTRDGRPEIFLRRAAPIQVNYLGYPGSMGTDAIDYLIADRIVVPDAQRSNFSEKIVHLPDSYQPNDSRRPIGAATPTRSQCGLPEEGFVFCCFNTNVKISPDMFGAWMRILARVPGGVLWLFEGDAAVVENLRAEAQRRDIDPRRLAFAKRAPSADHLARHRLADLFLDTLPFNAHTTASDALWAGLPVLTQIGGTFAGRVAASLLSAVGLPDLITNGREEYEALAVELATHPAKLSAIRERLAANRLTAPLFDTPRYTRALEAAYRAMVERRLSGLAPDHISV